jgi:hypothetical protein
MDKETISLTDFRANLYALVDRMIKTGKPLLLRRNDHVFELCTKPCKPPRRKTKVKRDLSKIIPISCMTEPPEWYISPKLYEWSGEIEPDLS